MPAKSKSQRRLFGMAAAMKRGEMQATPGPAADIAENVSMEDIDKFAKTKEKGLPMRRHAAKKGMRRSG